MNNAQCIRLAAQRVHIPDWPRDIADVVQTRTAPPQIPIRKSVYAELMHKHDRVTPRHIR